ncbi:hypothetical protein [Amycolatopsis speibonae]|uniref:Uncharacterized protein n=1 Tax=Amycolatopsis speibonae TaxID=1450224 RepID=A0ABV7NNA1_9PSEU
MNANLVTAEQLLKVEAIVTGLRELDATADGHEALAMAQAGFTHPDDM